MPSASTSGSNDEKLLAQPRTQAVSSSRVGFIAGGRHSRTLVRSIAARESTSLDELKEQSVRFGR